MAGSKKNRAHDELIADAEALWVSPEGEYMPVTEHILAIRERPHWFGLDERSISALNPLEGGFVYVLRDAVARGFVRFRYFANPSGRHMFDVASWASARHVVEAIVRTKHAASVALADENVSIVQADGRLFRGTVDDILKRKVKMSATAVEDRQLREWSCLLPEHPPRKTPDGIDRTPEGQQASLASAPFASARERMRKRAAAKQKRTALPHAGIWYWVFLAPEWKLFTWDFPVRDRIDFLHVQVWPDLVRNHLRPHYGLSEKAIKAASELPYSFPRGRVTAIAENAAFYLFVRHGNDTPVPDGLRQVESKFNLARHIMEGLAEEIYDPHETMVAEQRARMEAILAQTRQGPKKPSLPS